MARKLATLSPGHDDPDMELAHRLSYLRKPLTVVTDSDGRASVVLPMDQFRELMHYIRSLLLVVNAPEEDFVHSEELVSELRASGLLQT
jgi:hypothetical protein